MKHNKIHITEVKKHNGVYIMELRGNTKEVLRGSDTTEKLKNAIQDFLKKEKNNKSRELANH